MNAWSQFNWTSQTSIIQAECSTASYLQLEIQTSLAKAAAIYLPSTITSCKQASAIICKIPKSRLGHELRKWNANELSIAWLWEREWVQILSGQELISFEFISAVKALHVITFVSARRENNVQEFFLCLLLWITLVLKFPEKLSYFIVRWLFCLRTTDSFAEFLTYSPVTKHRLHRVRMNGRLKH